MRLFITTLFLTIVLSAVNVFASQIQQAANVNVTASQIQQAAGAFENFEHVCKTDEIPDNEDDKGIAEVIAEQYAMTHEHALAAVKAYFNRNCSNLSEAIYFAGGVFLIEGTTVKEVIGKVVLEEDVPVSIIVVPPTLGDAMIYATRLQFRITELMVFSFLEGPKQALEAAVILTDQERHIVSGATFTVDAEVDETEVETETSEDVETDVEQVEVETFFGGINGYHFYIVQLDDEERAENLYTFLMEVKNIKAKNYADKSMFFIGINKENILSTKREDGVVKIVLKELSENDMFMTVSEAYSDGLTAPKWCEYGEGTPYYGSTSCTPVESFYEDGKILDHAARISDVFTEERTNGGVEDILNITVEDAFNITVE